MTQPAGGYDVDITRAPEAIRDLEQALAELKGVRRDAVSLGQVNAPALDQVSQDAATVLGRTAIGTKTSFVEALDAGIAELDRMVRSLQQGFDAYRQGDEGVARGFGRGS